jgi:glycosyltransferase involved in cell wall biosynthesis
VYGGGEFVAVALANALAQNNHDVVLFTNTEVNAKAIHNYFGESLSTKVTGIVQPTHFNPRELADFYQTIVHSYIAKSKCNLFLDAFSNCVFPWTDMSYIHFPYLNKHAFNKKFPYLASPRIMQAGTVPHVVFEKNFIKYDRRLIMANSYFTANEIRQYSDKTVEVLYPPFASAISKIGKATTKDSGENLVVTVSRLEYNKLLERIPYIAAQTRPDTQFAIIGRLYHPQTLANLQAIIKRLGLVNRVKIYPNASAEQKISLLKRAKLYLHTMEGEHFGISIVEAMALGCLPIVHNSGGMVEFVPAKYRYESIPEAAEKITTALNAWRPQDAQEMKQIADQFSIPNFTKRFMTLFDRYYD